MIKDAEIPKKQLKKLRKKDKIKDNNQYKLAEWVSN